MRDIKFRAWVKHEKKMLYNDCYICFSLCGKLVDGRRKLENEIDTPFFNPMYGEELNQENHILMQYTGLQDKNGREIYEGDILMNQEWWWGPGFVYFHVGEVGPCRGENVMNYILSKNISDPLKGASHNLWNGREVEVLGNIYENPELIPGA